MGLHLLGLCFKNYQDEKNICFESGHMNFWFVLTPFKAHFVLVFFWSIVLANVTQNAFSKLCLSENGQVGMVNKCDRGEDLTFNCQVKDHVS